MVDLFFYGTLRHVPLLECVLGRSSDQLDCQNGSLPGYGAFAVRDECFPMISADPDGAAPGILVRGLTPGDIDRLAFYEGGFGYDLRDVSISLDDGTETAAQVFFPQEGLWQLGDPWSLRDWAAEWGDLTLRAAEEVMSYYGRMSAAEIAQRFPSIRLRAAAWLAAQQRPADPDRDIARDVVVHDYRRAYLNFFAMEEVDLQFRRHDGTMSAVMNRSAFFVGQAAVVLPYDPVRDCVLLTEQFRTPVFLSGDRAPWVWEPVAGLVDPGETPEQAAHREAMEEAGLTLAALEKAGEVYSSTGSSSEYLHLYVGITALTGDGAIGGLASEGEDIRSRILSYDELMEGVDGNRYRDMPLVTTALWLARHRDRLRAAV